MGRFVKGEVVVTQYPYSDLSASKKRPALVVAAFPKSSVLILAQITSREIADESVIELSRSDFKTGALRADSYIRTNFLFTCAESLPLYSVGHLSDAMLEQVITKLIEMLNRE